MNTEPKNLIVRPPVVAVMGHIDHGKSTLLDYIRKTNIVDKEFGGITQCVSAYEVLHDDEAGVTRKITFLDTPGHEAFQSMRERGAQVADVAILVVSAEDGVKTQTLEAWKAISESKVPVIVAINKIDKENANVERTKMNLAEHEIYLEGYGGGVPFVEISAKAGTGVDRLLELVLLIADIAELRGDPTVPASGVIVESHLDPKRGITATLIIKNGTIRKGEFIVAGETSVGTRMLEDFRGKSIEHAEFSSPIQIVGFSSMPLSGTEFQTVKTKKDAEALVEENKSNKKNPKKSITTTSASAQAFEIPIILKADSGGMLEVLDQEIEKVGNELVHYRVIGKSVGNVSENDIKLASAGSKNTMIVGFNIGVDPRAADANITLKVPTSMFKIIYELTDFIKKEAEARRPRIMTAVIDGKAKVLKLFSETKERRVIGVRVLEGKVRIKEKFKILRRENEVGEGIIENIEKGKAKTSEVMEGDEFGAMVATRSDIAPGDVLEFISMVER